MASSAALSLLGLTSSLIQRNPNPDLIIQVRTKARRRVRAPVTAVKAEDSPHRPTRLVTFLGKGGSGKTTSAILAAQHYVKAGLNTCLVIHSQDPTADFLLGCKIGTSPTVCNNLTAVRLETTKMLLEPLNQLKQADARLNLTQGFLERVVGEELGVLPGMDSIFSALAVDKLVGFFGNVAQRNRPHKKFDIIIYDGISTEETLRMIGAASRARWYLKYLRNMAEKTDIGRLIGPSLLRLADEAMRLSGGRPHFDAKPSAAIWDSLEQALQKASASFAEPSKFSCYLMMDPNNPVSVNAALHYWGCAIQAGAQVSGAFGFVSPQFCAVSADMIEENFSPLPFTLMPHLLTGSSLDWDPLMNFLNEDVQEILSVPTSGSSKLGSSVKFNPAEKSVTLFMPGFDKSEIKLYQYRGGSELLVEAGDQRRVILLPPKVQGKVGGAKFTHRNLVIAMR